MDSKHEFLVNPSQVEYVELAWQNWRTSEACSTFLLSFHFIPVEELDEAKHGHEVVRGVLGDGARDVLQQRPHHVLAAPSESELLCTVILRLK